MCDPAFMCRKHLTGEHVETHMFLSSARQWMHLFGFLEKNLLEPLSLWRRHEELAEEMLRRGMRHESEMSEQEVMDVFATRMVEKDREKQIDKEEALQELMRRCEECRTRFLSGKE